MVVHSQEQGMTLPYKEEGIFAILQIGPTQYKVAKDDKIICEKMPYEVGKQIELDKVLLVGTKDYTSIGRPYVNAARVYSSILINY